MKTRNQEQGLHYLLALNPIRERTEEMVIVAVSPSREKLVEFYNSQLCEEYTEEINNETSGYKAKFNKSFRKGGPLEWMNPTDLDTLSEFSHGIIEEWITMESIPLVQQRYLYIPEDEQDDQQVENS